MEKKKQSKKTDAYLYTELVGNKRGKCMTYLPLYIRNIHQNAQFYTKYNGKNTTMKISLS